MRLRSQTAVAHIASADDLFETDQFHFDFFSDAPAGRSMVLRFNQKSAMQACVITVIRQMVEARLAMSESSKPMGSSCSVAIVPSHVILKFYRWR
ncbi:hypothetical protein ACFSHT_21750 [Paraburkholderia silviterrae]|uniref:Uncharacterized protein n=1 Tax=Paraburkholderia silviterrae TaxID=2528715 RepID=A0A4R5MG09_9BURK|nr:hypothetical protein [Paraburkholderia silviterrae]TDG25977.1 hypothetical protein EYW47_01020 [Paraburkholderia silviterrae]